MKLATSKGIRDYETEQKLLEPQVNMELEYNDSLRANLITFKFLAFKTATSLKNITLPNRMFLSFKFFTFDEVTTEPVDLVLSGDLERAAPPNGSM
eukprot:CAMPEP_0116888954 /NCGR_PEP_ID=MMETSP0463-20121206/24242_1 /TAXON_ID=181622 /ORGANISM="Strombidinopsis sp, Strain SopsisLIS2011" /LENGTH=95 /DNA_ID=CAMNT_0004554767 /DNA_START=1852 /DNA_END=2139 /DNA_ORIENTATION=-